MTEDWQTVVTVLAAIGGIASPALVYRIAKKKLEVDAPHQIIDQLQEERAEDRKSYQDREVNHNRQMTRAFDRIEGLETQTKVQWDYILQLRYFIAKPSDAQPPTLPQALIQWTKEPPP